MKDNKDNFEVDTNFEPVSGRDSVKEETSMNGNTLDYYNEDMSRRAVGKLFDEPQDDSVEEDGLVKGYSKTGKPASKTTTDSDSSKRLKTKSRKIDWDDDTDDALEYDFSLYRRKDKQDPPKKEPIRSGTGRNEAIRKEPIRSDMERTDTVKIQPIQSAAPKLKKYNHFEDDDYEEQDLDDFDEYEDYEDEATGSTVVKRIMTGGIIFVFLVITAVLVYKLNDANAKLKDSLAKLEESSTFEQTISDQQIELATKQQDIDRLTSELDAYKNGGVTAENPDETSDAPATTPAPEGQSTAPVTTAGGRKYTVAAGDNLGKISKKFYGSLNDYQKIIDANSLPNESISVGQELIIP